MRAAHSEHGRSERVAACRLRSRAVASAASLLLLASGALAPAAGAEPVLLDVVTSSGDGAQRVEASQRPVEPVAPGGAAVAIALDRPRQRLRGVGAALTESSAWLIAGLPAAERHALLASLFDPAQAGVSVVRLAIGASDFSLEHRSLAESPVPDPELTTFSIERDRQWVIPVLQEILAIRPDVEIMGSPWSAPGWMKEGGFFLLGSSLVPAFEDAFARYLVRFVEAYGDEGIPVGWLTVQNEPAAFQSTYPSMVMFPDQQARLLREHLGPALAEAGLATRVLIWDHNWCDARFPGTCAGPAPPSFPFEVMAETGRIFPIAGTALHCYGGDQIVANEAIHDAWPDLEIWQTECSAGEWLGTRAQAFQATAHRILNDWNHWANASLLWNFALDPDNGPHLGGCETCWGVVTIDPGDGSWVRELEWDVLAIVSRFGPPGSAVLETSVTPETGAIATGVCSPEGRPAAIVLNPGPAATLTIAFGDLHVPVAVGAASLSAVRAPAGVACTPVPEPGGGLLAAAAVGALLGLARLRRLSHRLSPEQADGTRRTPAIRSPRGGARAR
ncbi:MAG: glycosyl hydrolase [Deltaproteobacteria bacterium]|nr:glycosyl hydrolase [Deltaproteobacteria bacterium]